MMIPRQRFRCGIAVGFCIVLMIGFVSPALGQETPEPSAQIPADASDTPAQRNVSPVLSSVVIRVLSYNIHHGEGSDGKLDLERIAEVIRSSQADVVALQEVDRNTTRTGSVDQAATLAELTKMHHAFERNLSLQGGDYGNAVLSKFPIVSSQNHPLPRRDNGEQRGAMEVEIQYSSKHPPIRLIATHLDHRHDERERVESAIAINQLILRREPLPSILAGDLNDDPLSQTLNELAKQWQRTSTTAQPTVPVARPTEQIDFVLVRPAQQWTVVETRVLDRPLASDHLPILATLQLHADGPSSARSKPE